MLLAGRRLETEGGREGWDGGTLFTRYGGRKHFIGLAAVGRPSPIQHRSVGMARAGRGNFLEVSDCFEHSSSSRWPAPTNVRRSSTVQFPLPSVPPPPVRSRSPLSANFLHSAISSTLNAVGLLNGVGLGGLRSPSSVGTADALNLYSMMAAYQCCFGFVRLRLASLLVGLLHCFGCTLLLCSLLLHSPFSMSALLPPFQYQLVWQPTVFLLSLNLLASLLLLLSLATDIHFLLLPFLFTCVLDIMGSLVLGVVLQLKPSFPVPLPPLRGGVLHRHQQFVPLKVALFASALCALFLWLLMLTGYTYVLIRDKQSLFQEYFYGDCMNELLEDELKEREDRVLIRRSSSAPLNRIPDEVEL